jgi:exonuclease III|tara:strand:- start:102 stop:1004 length:903 start_codon:yes stop_codon:yes gene_type:complete
MIRCPNYLTTSFLSLLLFSCGTIEEPTDETVLDSIGSSETVEIVTWNIQNFPKESQQTIEAVKTAIISLDADIYCIQEVEDKGSFAAMAETLEDFDYILSDSTSYIHFGILYKTEVLEFLDSDEIFTQYSYDFASRPPLLANFLCLTCPDSFKVSVIDLHLKCCDGSDNLERREAAISHLHDYLSNKISSNEPANFIVVGDWNDELDEPQDQNPFMTILNDSTNFRFANYDLAVNGSVYYASYPGWPSFIDHILISKSLFDEEVSSSVLTLRLDDFFDDYEITVSDHRPVAWIFSPSSSF